MSDNINQEKLNEDYIPSEEFELIKEASSNKRKSENVIDKIIELITGFSSDERIKIRKLKDINKKLKHLKLKFYNYKNDLIQTPFAQFFYELYRECQNFNKYINIKVHAKSIKLILFEIFSTTRQKKLLEEFGSGVVNQKIKKAVDKKKALSEIQNDLSEYINSFSSDIINKINITYNQIEDLSNMITYDWQYLLHKFDSEISETNFNYKPEFETIEGKYILDELVVINDYIESIDFDRDWKYLFEYLKYISQDEGLVKILNKLLQKCKILKNKHYLLYMVRLIYKDPFFKPKIFTSETNIVQDYLNNFKLEVKKSVDSIIKELKRERIIKLLLNIFNKTSIIRLKHYSENMNDFLMKKGVIGFKYVEPLNYLKAFLLDFCKGIIKPRIDFLLIKGTWTTNDQSLEYSSLLMDINKLSDKVLAFDNSCSEDEYYGKSIRQLAFVVAHDQRAKKIMRNTILKVDSEAEKILYESVNLLSDIIKKIKRLIDDKSSKLPKIIINFHKLEWDFPESIQESLIEIYKKLHNFINLLKYFIKDKK